MDHQQPPSIYRAFKWSVSTMLRILTLALHLSLTYHPTSAHPQCLDFRPPFPSPQLNTCREFSTFGCCSADMDYEIGKRVREVLNRGFGHPDCADLIREVLCLNCSPYAAHIFAAEDDGVPAPFPGLCGPYCRTFYEKCRNYLPYMISGNFPDYRNGFGQFCENIKISDKDYCHPDLNSNPIFRDELVMTSSTEEGCLCLEVFAGNLRSPLIFRHFPDKSGRIAIAEQIGVVHVYTRNGSHITNDFLNIQNMVLTSSRNGDERGLLGLAFHPDFAQNKKFYCFFSTTVNRRHYTRISEFRVSDTNPNKAMEVSERVLLQVEQPRSNHNGGEILFGNDGYLYLFLGDGGAAGDPGNRAQNKATLLGKVLRIDVTPSSSLPYTIPSDNPFVGETGARPEIYAYGIRNIWRCDIDEGDPITGANKGRIICGDVGQNAMEEVDIIEYGGNYGWNAREGTRCYRGDICDKIGPEVFPIHAYSHSEGKSITGGHVYRGCQNPALNGRYIFGDYVRGRLFQLEERGRTWQSSEIIMCGSDVCSNGLVHQYEKHILSFGEDEDGEIYMLATGRAVTSQPRGKVYKLVDPRRRGDPTTCRSYIQGPRDPEVTTRTSIILSSFRGFDGISSTISNRRTPSGPLSSPRFGTQSVKPFGTQSATRFGTQSVTRFGTRFTNRFTNLLFTRFTPQFGTRFGTRSASTPQPTAQVSRRPTFPFTRPPTAQSFTRFTGPALTGFTRRPFTFFTRRLLKK